MSLTIRVATPDDLPALADLAARTFPLACPPRLTDADIAEFIAANLSSEHLAAHLADPGHRVAVADSDGALAGYTLCVTGEPYDAHIAGLVRRRPTVELSKCYADPSVHGSGVAAALMDETADWARSMGAASVWLGVNALNERAQKFYAKHGFARIGTRRFTVGDAVEDDYVLERELAHEQRVTDHVVRPH